MFWVRGEVRLIPTVLTCNTYFIVKSVTFEGVCDQWSGSLRSGLKLF